jgi:hypothetical protein
VMLSSRAAETARDLTVGNTRRTNVSAQTASHVHETATRGLRMRGPSPSPRCSRLHRGQEWPVARCGSRSRSVRAASRSSTAARPCPIMPLACAIRLSLKTRTDLEREATTRQSPLPLLFFC